METELLIRRLAREAARQRRSPWRIERALLVGSAAGFATAAGVVLLVLGSRPDLLDSLSGGAALMKVAIGATVAAASFQLLRRLSRPGTRPMDGPCICLMVIAGLIASGHLLAAEQTATPAAVIDAAPAYGGKIALFSGLPLLVLLLALAPAAPTRLAGTGAAAGLMASALGGMGFAIWCPAEDILFVVSSYGLASLLAMIAGAVLGRALLRW